MIWSICSWLYLFLLLIAVIKSACRLRSAQNFLLTSQQNQEVLKAKRRQKIAILIPVYEEERSIAASIKHFMKLHDLCHVYYITTAREKNKKTYSVIKSLICEFKPSNITLLDAPNIKGNMATQLNFAAKQLSEKTIIGIYNVDSFPEEKVFIYVLNHIAHHPIMQQVSYFADNRQGILASVQRWQNRWSIIYELGKYIETFQMKKGFIYTIGHGFFVRKEILTKYGLWDDTFMNEDNELGYRLMLHQAYILPIPYLEKSGFAKSLIIYVKQQATWFNGPLDAFAYFHKNKQKNWRSFLLTCLNFKAALSWLLFPMLGLVCLIFAISAANMLQFFLIVAGICVYVNVYNTKVHQLLRDLNYLSKADNKSHIWHDFLFFFVHSFGPMLTIGKIVLGKNTIQHKYKTEK